MNHELRMFCDNWIQKADSYNENQLSDHFDKFTSLYVAYNALYMETMNVLHSSGRDIPKNFKDKKAAIDYVIQYLGSKHYCNTLLNLDNTQDALEQIVILIEEERFYIILDWGLRQRNKDLELIEQIRSNSKQIKAKAILTFLYGIRCNMFHGHKGFVPYQRDLLMPTNILLRRTVQILFDRLNQ